MSGLIGARRARWRATTVGSAALKRPTCSPQTARKGGDSSGQRVTPVEHETELFSKTLARYLDKARNEHRYDKLYLIAPPEFLGLMRENLSKEVRKLTAEEINKDLSWFDARDIERHVKPLSKPAWARDGKGNGGGKARAAKSVLRVSSVE